MEGQMKDEWADRRKEGRTNGWLEGQMKDRQMGEWVD